MQEKTVNYKAVVEYDGSRYQGWQKQGNTENTIQAKIENVLSIMAEQRIEIHGSGRTDAGVHARGQVFNFHLPQEISPADIRNYLNHYLPDDIRVLEISTVTPRFHSRLSAVRKTYSYQIKMKNKRSVFERKYQYAVEQRLDIESMKTAATGLCGLHDFKSFCGNKHMKKSTTRIIESIEITSTEDLLTITVVANGFLQNMMRILVGTLVEVGQGQRNQNSMQRILEEKNRQSAGFMAPAHGLTLMSVDYK